jgi:hypothetical protein
MSTGALERIYFAPISSEAARALSLALSQPRHHAEINLRGRQSSMAGVAKQGPFAPGQVFFALNNTERFF